MLLCSLSVGITMLTWGLFIESPQGLLGQPEQMGHSERPERLVQLVRSVQPESLGMSEQPRQPEQLEKSEQLAYP
jgi:hypothetical protein